jgi:hypothetical protein
VFGCDQVSAMPSSRYAIIAQRSNSTQEYEHVFDVRFPTLYDAVTRQVGSGSFVALRCAGGYTATMTNRECLEQTHGC